jgi:multiple sugar transport system substrate-binding protein
LIATAQRFEETNRFGEILWSKHSLHEFGHADLGSLAREFDLIVMDHPWVGYALESGAVLPLEERLPRHVLDYLACNSAGRSFESYMWKGHLLAIPVDSASPVASYRSDLLAAIEVPMPTTWRDVIELAKKKRVIMPGHPVDILLNFVGLCVSQGGMLFNEDGIFVDRETGRLCLGQIEELNSYIPREASNWNPIQVYEQMTKRDDWAYCPFAFGYSNYSRPGFAHQQITFANLVELSSGQTLRGVLGGTGIAISSSCTDVELALEYAIYIASRSCQMTTYFSAGGQPSNLQAWTDGTVNMLSGEFFRNTLRSLKEAWLRPRYNGYIQFQELAATKIAQYFREGGNENALLDTLDRIYSTSYPPLQKY